MRLGGQAKQQAAVATAVGGPPWLQEADGPVKRRRGSAAQAQGMTDTKSSVKDQR